jgi:hypothetical protein
LIEETLKDLVGLRGEEARNNYRRHGFENFIKALDGGLGEVGELGREIKPEEVRTNLLIFVGKRLKHALKLYTDCWKRTALIIGFALAGYSIVPRPEDLLGFLPEDLRGNVAKSLGNALNKCEIDDYLLTGNIISPLIMGLTRGRTRVSTEALYGKAIIEIITYTHALTEAFIDRYDEVVAEVRRVLGIARGRGSINPAEGFYGLGLASIIAKAVELGKPIEPGDADAALNIASSAIQHVALPDLIMPILVALEPLRGKVPHRYLELLAPALNMENLDLVTVRYILNELNEVLDNYGDVVRGYAWSLVYAIRAYANLLGKYLSYFNNEEVENVVGRVADLLNELDKLSPSLGVIAWAYALVPALWHEDVRGLMEKALCIKVVDKVNEVLEKLNKMRDEVQELMSDKNLTSYIKSMFVKADEKKADEEAVIFDMVLFLKHALAFYRLNNGELEEALRLFNEAAREYRGIVDYKNYDYENYLIVRSWALRAEAIKGSLVGDELVKLRNEFQRLYEETFNVERFKLTARYLSTASTRLGEYLVSLALTGDYETISRLLEEHLWVLNADYKVSVLTRLMLNALLGLKDRKDRLGGELKGRLVVEPGELIESFRYEMHSEFLPALMVVFGVMKSEDGIKLCERFIDKSCIDSVLAAKGNSAAVKRLREGLIYDFRERISEEETLDLLKRLGVNADKLLGIFDEFMELVNKFDGEPLVQLIAPNYSIARLVLMLYALANNNERLTKAHALRGSTYSGKLLSRLFLEIYKTCCDPNNEGFRRAIAKLFFLHV